MTYYLEIEPQPTPRPSVNTYTGVAYYPGSYNAYKKALYYLLKNAMKITCMEKSNYSEVGAEFYFTYPKSTAKKNLIDNAPHTKKPDIDNLLKGLMDAMEDAGIFTNDSRAHSIIARKMYTTKSQGYIILSLS